MAAERMMTVREWATLIGVSRSQAYALIAAGLVEPNNVSDDDTGRPLLRISESAHAAYVKRSTLAAPGRRGAR